MNSNREILNKISKYEPLFIGLFCLFLVATILGIPYLQTPIFVFTYALIALYGFKVIVPKSELNRIESLIRNAYLLLIILGLLSLVLHVQYWIHLRWAMSTFLIGIPVLIGVSLVKKIEFKVIFGATDAFLATAIYFVLVPIFFDRY